MSAEAFAAAVPVIKRREEEAGKNDGLTLVGGLLVQAWSWRLAFLVNLPVAALCVYLALRFVPILGDSSAAPAPS